MSVETGPREPASKKLRFLFIFPSKRHKAESNLNFQNEKFSLRSGTVLNISEKEQGLWTRKDFEKNWIIKKEVYRCELVHIYIIKTLSCQFAGPFQQDI